MIESVILDMAARGAVSAKPCISDFIPPGLGHQPVGNSQHLLDDGRAGPHGVSTSPGVLPVPAASPAQATLTTPSILSHWAGDLLSLNPPGGVVADETPIIHPNQMNGVPSFFDVAEPHPDVATPPNRALDPLLLHEMEHRFGADFSGISVQRGVSPTDRSAGVRAVAEREHIAAEPDILDKQRDPANKQVLAEELAHIVQKRKGAIVPDEVDTHGPNSAGQVESSPRNQLEAEAKDGARRAVAGENVSIGSGAHAPVRQFHVGDTTSATEYVDMNATGKTNALVTLMNDSGEVLDANGVSSRGEELLAGIMRNEGGRNQRHKAMDTKFNKDAATLNKLDLAHLSKKQIKNLTPEQKALLERAQAGSLDLHDPESVTKAGVDIRRKQYERMVELSQKTKGGKLTKKEKAEQQSLQRTRVEGGGRLNDFRGMSGDRFQKIFDEGQTRFELGQYTKFRKSWEKQESKAKQASGDKTISAGIGTAKLDAGRQEMLHKNLDLLADYSTSYGTSQIMGLYADQGLLTSKNGSGQNHTFTLDELKGSAQRYSPNAEDVQMQLGFTNMKGIDMGQPPKTRRLAELYNGKNQQANGYEKKMVNGAQSYRAAKYKQEHQAK